MSRYSDTIITLDNEDEELEKISERFGIPLIMWDGEEWEQASGPFVGKRPDGFSKCDYDGTDVWIKSGIFPDYSSDRADAIERGQMAFEFANSFESINFERLL